MTVSDQKRAAAKQIFKCVTGVLNGAFDESRCESNACTTAVTEWLGEREQGSDVDTSSFTRACDALTVAISVDAVPPQGLQVLAGLHSQLLKRCNGLRIMDAVAVHVSNTTTPLVHSAEGTYSEASRGAVHGVSGRPSGDASSGATGVLVSPLPEVPAVSSSIASSSYLQSERESAGDSQVLLEQPPPPSEVATPTVLNLSQTPSEAELIQPPITSDCKVVVPVPTPSVAVRPATEARRAAVKLIHSCVTGVMSGAYKKSRCESLECVAASKEWLDDYADSVGLSPEAAADLAFVQACQALALAVGVGAVPIRGLTVLLKSGKACDILLQESIAKRLQWLSENLDKFHSQWEELVEMHAVLQADGFGEGSCIGSQGFLREVGFCPRCVMRAPRCPMCQQCSGAGIKPCTKCSGSGIYMQPCRTCYGTGKGRYPNPNVSRGPDGKLLLPSCQRCQGSGNVQLGDCNHCRGGVVKFTCEACAVQADSPDSMRIPLCTVCIEAVAAETKQQQESDRNRRSQQQSRLADGPPAEGVTIRRSGASDLARLQKVWAERAGNGSVEEAWSIDNPLMIWKFRERKKELERALGKLPDELEAFHGSNANNYLSIVQGGFRSDLRSGQAYGSGEYLAKCPNVSVGYCRGGEYMLVCQVLLGFESFDRKNQTGDHIWVPECQYYVISRPAQVLPRFILKFQSGASHANVKCDELKKILATGNWTTKKAEELLEVPVNRPCLMSRPTATVLWMGLMQCLDDEQLEADVRRFFAEHARSYTEMRVQIVRGTFKKAHVILETPIPRDLVHRLNALPFTEGGKVRTICVDDAHGSPEQKCPKFIAKYCRGQNLRFTHPCWCWHPRRETDGARYTLDSVELGSAKGNEIMESFSASAPFHDGAPRIVSIKSITNRVLSRLHEEYRRYLATKHREEPQVRELYHGTNMNILDMLCTHGLQPPSDCAADDLCPNSGGKGLSTTLCNNDCEYCTEKHEWNRCHMFGLGIYLADLAQKSHRYVSQPVKEAGRLRYKMIICAVLGRAFKVEGHLTCDRAMHDVANVRALNEEDLENMVVPCTAASKAKKDVNADAPAEKSDMLFVQGLGSRCRPGYSVFNSEYVAFHPHQCLPKYEITYEM